MSRRSNKFRKGSAVTEEQVIEFLNLYFSVFESDLKNNKISEMNVQLPRLIVEKFEKLFRLWDENRILEKSINKDVFRSIHSMMSNTFDEFGKNDGDMDSSVVDDVFFECRQCGEEIVIRNNNLRYSHDFHKTTSEHLELVAYMNGDCDGEHNVVKRENSNRSVVSTALPIYCTSEQGKKKNALLAQTSEKKVSSSKRDNAHQSPKTDSLLCKSQVSTKSKSVTVHSAEENILFIDKFDTKCISIVNNEARCKVCLIKLSSSHTYITHISSRNHAKNKQLFRLNKMYVLDVGTKISCKLCNTRYSKMNKFLNHCIRYNHRSKSVADTSNPLHVDGFTTVFECPACEMSIMGVKLLFEHFKEMHEIC